MDGSDRWPELPFDEWKETCATLHMWTQVVGKVKLELVPFLNEWWQVAFRISSRGMTTGLIPWRDGGFEILFDFLDHNLFIQTSDGRTKALPLTPRSVAEFYAEIMTALRTLGIEVVINTLPCEVPDPVHCHLDESHSAYDAEYVRRWWWIQLRTDAVLQRHRSGFVGKSSPIHFFWGSFDLNHTRYSGRPAPPAAGMPRFFQIAEDQENVACGFWPGNANLAGVTLGEPAFYSYIYPEPEGFKEARVRPTAARYDARYGEFILPYEAVRTSDAPADTLLDFVSSVYEAAATLAGWDRRSLERTPPSLPRAHRGPAPRG